MPYSELIKNFNKTRDYMRDFYVYGYKTREGFTRKSARTYDDEKRRIENWLGDYMKSYQTGDGKINYISINSRGERHNPLFAAWKTKSFTDGEIAFHFFLMDLLADPETSLSINEIMSELADTDIDYDQSAIQKKLKKYENEGILTSVLRSKTKYYSRTPDSAPVDPDALGFMSEVMPCGVIGSFIADKEDAQIGNSIAFKHHYITNTMDSEVLCTAFGLIHSRENAMVTMCGPDSRAIEIVSLRIFISVQNGRQYLMGYDIKGERFASFRLDRIDTLESARTSVPDYDTYSEKLDQIIPHLWGVSMRQKDGDSLETVEFTVVHEADETFIVDRLKREKRCGEVIEIDKTHAKFTATVYDSKELVPWIRTFIGRIENLSFSNAKVQADFERSLNAMYAAYGLAGKGEGDATNCFMAGGEPVNETPDESQTESQTPSKGGDKS